MKAKVYNAIEFFGCQLTDAPSDLTDGPFDLTDAFFGVSILGLIFEELNEKEETGDGDSGQLTLAGSWLVVGSLKSKNRKQKSEDRIMSCKKRNKNTESL